MLKQNIIELLKEKNYLLVTAESLTAGLICSNLAEVQGASQVLFGGFNVYQVAAKVTLLGLEPTFIEKYGVVSAEVAEAMALKALERVKGVIFDQDVISVSVTGFAGPTGGTKDYPVGTVFMSLAWSNEKNINKITEKFFFEGTRNEVRNKTFEKAMKKILVILKEIK